ncbi:porin [Hyphomicrobium sp.]|uniref:porin n=1 Tax=Hyphomicrobium sp. TaxID=82 RepID=UPI002D78198F|nr:porin [Hyphomicrobium sp.]HET6388583.1 porin [Hyphomicrobium sp.]
MFGNSRRVAAAIGTVACLGSSPAGAQEFARFNLWDQQSWISIGAGLRGQYISDVGLADPTQEGWELNSARLYIQGQANKHVGFTYNTDIDQDSHGNPTGIQTLDALGRIEFMDEFNLYGGRMLPPSDRVNLDGPFNLGTWQFPFVSAYPNIFDGRDTGGSVWGDIGHFKYMLGGFLGCTADENSCFNRDANGPLFAGRIQYDFWDKEAGYYTFSSDYYGKKEVLSVGIVGQFQNDAASNGTRSADWSGFNVDVLMQKKVWNDDVFTIEGAYYIYDSSGLDTRTAFGGNGIADGNAYFILTSYLINKKVCVGRFQPVFRYQEFDHDFGPDIAEYSVGTNFIIDGHDALLSALFSHENLDEDGHGDVNRFILGAQVQF